MIKKIFKIFTIFLTTLFANSSFATDTYQVLVSVGNDIKAGESYGTSVYINNLYNTIFALAAVLAVVMIVVGGFMYLSSDAISNKSTGREKITGAIVGLLIVLGSYMLLNSVNPDLLKFRFANERLDYSGGVWDQIKADFYAMREGMFGVNPSKYSEPIKDQQDIQQAYTDYYRSKESANVLDYAKEAKAFYDQKKSDLPILEEAKKIKLRVEELKNNPDSFTPAQLAQILSDEKDIDNKLITQNLPTNLESIDNLISDINNTNTDFETLNQQLNLSENDIELIAQKDALITAIRDYKVKTSVLLVDAQDYYASGGTGFRWLWQDDPIEANLNANKTNFTKYMQEVEKFLSIQGNPKIDESKDAVLGSLIEEYKAHNDFVDKVCKMYLDSVANTDCPNYITKHKYTNEQINQFEIELKNNYRGSGA